MNNLPPFLSILGLDADADERAIRRAYAQRLKLIDQEADPAAFQSLHEAFEAASRWAKSKAKLAVAGVPQQANIAVRDQAPAASPNPTPEPARQPIAVEKGTPPHLTHHAASMSTPKEQPTPPRNPAPPPSAAQKPLRSTTSDSAKPVELFDQDTAGAAAFAEFTARFAQEARSGKLDEDAARKELERTLNDPRLLNLQVRASFERRVAELLAAGWRPGHHLLFDAAIKVFHWMDDKQRLDALDQLGAFLNQVLTEQSIFLNTSGAALKMRSRLIERLRDPQAPSEQEVGANLRTIEILFARYPNWLRLVTNVQNIAMWRQGAKQLVVEIEENTRTRKIAEKKQGLVGFVIFIGIIGLVLYANFKEDSSPRGNANFSSRYSGVPPTIFPSMPVNPGVAPATPLVPYTDGQIQQAISQIRSNLHFTNPGRPLSDNPVTFRVEVNADGQVTRVIKSSNSALLEFDRAVLRAIYDAQPFPKSTDQISSSSFIIRASPANK